MCSAQPVITPALMWSLGGTEASYYCRFYDNFHSLALHSPSLPPSLPRLVYPASLSPPFFPFHPSSRCLPPRPNPHPFLLLLQWDACLFLVCKPSWHTSPGQRADIGAFFFLFFFFGEGESWGSRQLGLHLQRYELGDGAGPGVVPSVVGCGWQLLFLVFRIIGLVTAGWHPATSRWWVCSAYVYVSGPVF